MNNTNNTNKINNLLNSCENRGNLNINENKISNNVKIPLNLHKNLKNTNQKIIYITNPHTRKNSKKILLDTPKIKENKETIEINSQQDLLEIKQITPLKNSIPTNHNSYVTNSFNLKTKINYIPKLNFLKKENPKINLNENFQNQNEEKNKLNNLQNSTSINYINLDNSPSLGSYTTNTKRINSYHAFKNSTLNSKSDRKNTQQFSVDFILTKNQQENNKKTSLSLLKKIPELKFPLNTYEQHYSLSRSSQRNDFIKSSGSSTTTGQTFQINKKIGLLNLNSNNLKKENLENISGSSKNLNYLKNNHYKHGIGNINNNITPINKLKLLAQTLGESCLAGDLASLINHKRDMELDKLTRDKNKTLNYKTYSK